MEAKLVTPEAAVPPAVVQLTLTKEEAVTLARYLFIRPSTKNRTLDIPKTEQTLSDIYSALRLYNNDIEGYIVSFEEACGELDPDDNY